MHPEHNDGLDPRDPIPRSAHGSRSYRYMLEDHPFIGPLITLILGGFCLYSTIFSHALRDLFLGPDVDPSLRTRFEFGTSWIVAVVIAVMLISFIFLIINLVDEALHKLRQRPAVCEKCGLMEVRRVLRFSHERMEGTSWETIICPRCRHKWYAKR